MIFHLILIERSNPTFFSDQFLVSSIWMNPLLTLKIQTQVTELSIKSNNHSNKNQIFNQICMMRKKIEKKGSYQRIYWMKKKMIWELWRACEIIRSEYLFIVEKEEEEKRGGVGKRKWILLSTTNFTCEMGMGRKGKEGRRSEADKVHKKRLEPAKQRFTNGLHTTFQCYAMLLQCLLNWTTVRYRERERLHVMSFFGQKKYYGYFIKNSLRRNSNLKIK